MKQKNWFFKVAIANKCGLKRWILKQRVLKKNFLFLSFFLFPFLLVAQTSSVSVLQTFMVGVNPKGTYLRTYQDSPESPTSFSLSANSIRSGDILYLMFSGDFNYFEDNESRSMMGVFTNTSGNFLSPGEESQLGWGVVSLNTYVENRPTDIPKDFHISKDKNSCTKVQVPEEATSILFSPNDAFFADNSDGDNDFVSNILICQVLFT